MAMPIGTIAEVAVTIRNFLNRLVWLHSAQLRIIATTAWSPMTSKVVSEFAEAFGMKKLISFLSEVNQRISGESAANKRCSETWLTAYISVWRNGRQQLHEVMNELKFIIK